MKKRKILVSLALASAALFSLAACNKTESTPTPTPAPTSAPAPATSTAPAASSTPAAASSSQAAASSSQAASTQKTVSFIAKYSDSEDEKELTDLTQTVEAGSTITAPTAPEETGYKFIKYTTLNGVDVDFTQPIDKNVELYANYDKLTQYHTMLAQAETLGVTPALAEDFNSISNLPTEKTAGKVSLYDASEGDAKVDIVNFKAELTTDINDKKSAVNVDFDTIQTESTITGYFEMKISAFKKDMFLHFKGKSGENNDYKILSMGMESDGRLRFKVDNEGSEITSGFNTTFKLSEDNNVIVYRIDTIAKTITIRINGTEVINYDYASNATFEGLNKVTIQCLADTKNHTTYTTYLNNMLVDVEQADLEQARTEAIATVSAFASNAKYQYAQAAIDAIIAKYTNATTGELVTADSITAVATKLNAAKAELADAIKNVKVTVKYYLENGTYVDGKDQELDTELGKVYTAAELAITGYVVEGLYTDKEFNTPYSTPITVSTSIYAKVVAASKVTMTYTPKAYVEGDKWITLSNSGTDPDNPTYEATDKIYKTVKDQASTPVEYNAIQITRLEIKDGDGNSYNPKKYNVSTILRSETITDATQVVTINVEGWSTASNDRKQQATAKAYDSTGKEIGSIDFYTSASKTNGKFSADDKGNVTDITLTATGNISYVEFTMNTDGKTYYVTSVKISYEKAN